MAINRKSPTPKKKKKLPNSLLSPAARLKMRQAKARADARKKK